MFRPADSSQAEYALAPLYKFPAGVVVLVGTALGPDRHRDAAILQVDLALTIALENDRPVVAFGTIGRLGRRTVILKHPELQVRRTVADRDDDLGPAVTIEIVQGNLHHANLVDSRATTFLRRERHGKIALLVDPDDFGAFLAGAHAHGLRRDRRLIGGLDVFRVFTAVPDNRVLGTDRLAVLGDLIHDRIRINLRCRRWRTRRGAAGSRCNSFATGWCRRRRRARGLALG